MVDVELHGGRQHNVVALDVVLTALTVIRRDDDEMPRCGDDAVMVAWLWGG